jgi:Big-like domain-containing protein
LGSATISGGIAVLTKTTLPAGSLPITAAYNGDSESAKSISASLIQVVKPASTVTTITSSLNPSSAGQLVTFTARVSSPTVHVTGMVVFTMGATTIGTVPLTAGKAVFATAALPKGKHQIAAGYGGTTNIKGSTASLTQTVN